MLSTSTGSSTTTLPLLLLLTGFQRSEMPTTSLFLKAESWSRLEITKDFCKITQMESTLLSAKSKKKLRKVFQKETPMKMSKLQPQETRQKKEL